MVFPLRGFFVCSCTAAFLIFIGFPVWATCLFCFLGFLKMGGLQFFRLVYRTLPTDLWMGRKYIKVIRELRKGSQPDKIYISDRFRETVAKYPNKAAILFEERKITFKELDELSNKIANLLLATTNVQRGDTIALFMDNCPEFVAIYLALSKIGVKGAFINHNLRGNGLAHCIQIGHCSGVFFSPGLSGAVSEILPELEESVSQLLYCVGGESSIPEAKNLDSELETCSPAPPPFIPGKSPEDLACYIYTSGTTGLPKACKINHRRFFGLQNGVCVFSEVFPEDIVYVTLPLYHTNGGILGCGQMLFGGCTIVIRNKFSASNFWTDCIKYQCTVCFYIGEVCRYILAQPKRPVDTQHCVRLMIGNGLRSQIWQKFTQRFQIPKISEFYGSTEGNVGIINPFNKVGACGRVSVLLAPLNPVGLVKVDPDTGEYIKQADGFCVKVVPGETGEVVGKIRQHVVTSHFDGYSDGKATSKKVMTDVFTKGDKYFMSGDILRMDEEGFLYFCDRTGDTFRWKGENVSTTEVESVMASILQLTDVVVYGVEVPGNEGRAGMAAIVGTRETVDLSGLAQQLFLSLPSYAVPLFIRLIPSADLTGTFKLKKVKLRNEGFEPSISDPLYVLDASHKVYQPLTQDLYQNIQDGKLRL